MDWNSITTSLIFAGFKLAGIIVAFAVVLGCVAYTVLAERRVLGFIQGRLGPNRVGYGGALQPFADLLKFILKEDIVPDKSTRFVYFLAPLIAIVAALMTLIVYPFGSDINLPFIGMGVLLIQLYLKQEAVEGGMLRIPDRPGLGITVREDFVARHAMPESPSWTTREKSCA